MIYIILFLSTVVSAQTPIIYTTATGLPSNHVYDIVQDKDGFIWMATNRGLVKYDGASFKLFTTKSGLPNNDTWGVEVDRLGRLFFFSKHRLQGYIYKDSIHVFESPNNKVIAPNFSYVTPESSYIGKLPVFYELREGKLDFVPFFLDEELEYFDQLSHLVGREKEQYFSLINSIHPIQKKLLTGIDGQFSFFNQEGDLLATYYDETTVDLDFSKRRGGGVLSDELMYLYFRKGILLVDYEKYTVELIAFSEEQKKQTITTKVDNGQLIVSFFNGFLTISNDGQTKTYTHYDVDWEHNGNYRDRDNNIWLTNLGKGVAVYPKTRLSSDYLFIGEKVQFLDDCDQSTDMWVGVGGKGMMKTKADFSKPTLIQAAKDETSLIYSVKNQAGKQFFIDSKGTYVREDGAVQQLKLDTIYKEKNKFFKAHTFKDVLAYKKHLYYATAEGIIRTDLKGKDARLILREKGVLELITYDEKLYFTGSGGLYVFEDLLSIPCRANLLLDVAIVSTTVDSDKLLLGTDGRGIYTYDGDAIVHLGNTDGFNVYKTIKEGDYLWCATQFGVQKVQIYERDWARSSIVDAYYKSDGLLEDNTNDILLRDSSLYVASDIGLARVNINDSYYKKRPVIYFSDQRDTITYNRVDRKNIAVSFAALDFFNQSYLDYYYRLLPLDDRWIKAPSKTLNFSNLKSDHYTLEVKVVNQHQQTSVIRKQLLLPKRWYETAVARLLFIFSIISLIIGVQWWINERNKEKLKEEMKREQQIAIISSQALRSQMNPHFVHNSLNTIRYYIQQNETDLSEQYLVKFSKLIRLFFEYSRRQTIAIVDELKLLENYLSIEKTRFEDKLNYVIIVDEDLDQIGLNIPSMLLQPIVENAVNHGVFHKKGEGNIEIRFKYISDFAFQVVIKDDGIGYEKSQEITESSVKNYKSNSSHVLKERLELLNKGREWRVDYELEDISQKTPELSGTIVTLTFNQLQ